MKVKRIRICGGAWRYDDRGARCAYRGRNTPGDRNYYVGFRVVFPHSL